MAAYGDLIGVLLASTAESEYLAVGHQRPLKSFQEWQDLYHLAQRQRIAAPLYAELQAQGLPLPPEIEALFKAEQRRITLSNLRLYANLHHLSAILGQAGIPFILLQGSHLVRAVYPSMALRTIVDIDLLCPASAWPTGYNRWWRMAIVRSPNICPKPIRMPRSCAI